MPNIDNTNVDENEETEETVSDDPVEVSHQSTSDSQETTEQLPAGNATTTENEFYPAAVLTLDSCIQDYQRLQENYNKIYEKTNIALGFVGIVFTIMFSTIDFFAASVNVSNKKVWEVMLYALELLCQFGSIILMIISIIMLLIVLKGKRMPVFNSVDIRNCEIYRLEENQAALWLIDKYTKIVTETRPIVNKKQKLFDNSLVLVIISIMTYSVSIILQKGGF